MTSHPKVLDSYNNIVICQEIFEDKVVKASEFEN